MYTSSRDVGLLALVCSVVSAQMLPDSQAFVMNELEHLYFDYTGPAGFKSGVDPCTIYIDSSTGLPNNAVGRETSAQWLRTIFRKNILYFFIFCRTIDGLGAYLQYLVTYL